MSRKSLVCLVLTNLARESNWIQTFKSALLPVYRRLMITDTWGMMTRVVEWNLGLNIPTLDDNLSGLIMLIEPTWYN